MVPMTNNLFPLPYWAPALQRVPIPLQVLNEAYLRGNRPGKRALWHDRDLGHAPSRDRRLSLELSPPR
jgi:hypothetical protein